MTLNSLLLSYLAAAFIIAAILVRYAICFDKRSGETKQKNAAAKLLEWTGLFMIFLVFQYKGDYMMMFYFSYIGIAVMLLSFVINNTMEFIAYNEDSKVRTVFSKLLEWAGLFIIFQIVHNLWLA